MSSPRPAQDPLHGVLEPIVTAAGLELEELDVRAVGRRYTVRLVVDADAGVDLDDIARISRDAAAETPWAGVASSSLRSGSARSGSRRTLRRRPPHCSGN